MPDTAQTVPIFSFGVGTRSKNVSAQIRENIYVEKLDDPDKTGLALYARPGLSLFAQMQGTCLGILCDVTLPAANGGEWILAVTDAMVNPGLGVYPTLRINGAGQVANFNFPLSLREPNIGQIGGIVRAASSGTECVWVDGYTGYRTELADNLFSTIELDPGSAPNATAFPYGAKSVAYCASRFVCDDPSVPGQWRWSAPGDGTSWSSLDFANAESNGDPLSMVFEAAGQLLLIGTSTIEFWAPAAAGASGQQPYVRVGGANIQWGTTAIDTVRKVNNAVIFMGRSMGGNRQIVLLDGYNPTVISTPDIEYQIQNDPSPDSARGMFFIANGHPFYVLNLTAESWAYDLRSQSWSKWTTNGSRYAGQWAFPAFGKMLASDYANGNVYAIDPTSYTDNGTRIVREVISKHAWANLARMSCQEIAIDCETGVGSTSSSAPTNDASPTIMLQWSKDGGHTWGNEAWQALGAAGSYRTRAVWRMLGRARDWIFKLRVTDNVKVVVIDASARFAP